MSPKNEPSIFVLEIGKKKKQHTDIKTSILWIDLGLYPHSISQQALVKIYWDLKSNMSESLADEFYSRQFRYHKWNWKFGIYPTLWWSFFYSIKIVWHLYTFALPSLYFPSDKGRQYFPTFYAPFIHNAYIVYLKGMKIEQFELFENFKSCFIRIIEVGLNWSCCDISARVKVDTGAQTLVSLWTCKLEPFEANVSSVKWKQISSNKFRIVILQPRIYGKSKRSEPAAVKCKPVFCS